MLNIPRPVVAPELSEVHVEGEVHELLGEVADAEDVERDPDSDRGPWAARHEIVVNIKIFNIDKS